MERNNKNILLIMPKFFDYPKIISKELEAMGFHVDFFDDRPSTKGIVKAIIRVKRNMINHMIKKYFQSIFETVKKKKYDYIILISGQSLSFSKEMLQQLKDQQQDAKFVLYQWDSMNNFPYIKEMHSLFDKLYSFDRKDCERCDGIRFLPLFYSERYKKIGEKKADSYQYDFCFVGTAHPQKYKFVSKMAQQLSMKFSDLFVYFFFPSRIVYYYRKIANPEFKNAKKSEFHFIPIMDKEMDRLITSSRCILDSPQDGQLGLTMRVFETLGAKRKLITTNQDIANYDFYRKENIYIYRGNFDFSSVFFHTEYHELPDEIYEKYSVRSWLNELLR